MQKLNNCKISLLIPTYNSAATLNKSLESVRNQYYPGVEVIVIDGGSSDDTLQITEEYQDLITIVISEPDNGIYDAINKGVSLASGNLISVLGSDDELCPNALKTIFEVWDSSDADIVAGRAIMVSLDGKEATRVDECYGLGALLSGIPFCHNAMFVTPETYRKVGAYNLNYNICADAEWVHRAIRLGCTCEQIDLPVVRFSLGGLSSTNPNDIMNETYQVIARNFHGITIEDAKTILYAIRGWSDDDEVRKVLQKYKSNFEFSHSALVAFKDRAQRLGKPVPDLLTVDAPISFLYGLAHRLHNYLKRFQ